MSARNMHFDKIHDGVLVEFALFECFLLLFVTFLT